MPDLHPEKSRPVPSRYCRKTGASSFYDQSGAASQQRAEGYRSGQAQKLTDVRQSEAYLARRVTNEVRNQIETLIRQELSPQQVADYLERRKIVSLHHGMIYQLIYADKANGGDLLAG